MMSADPCARSMDTSAPAAPAAPATRRSWNGRAPRGERESEAMSGHGPCARTCAAPPLPDPAGDALRQLHSNGLVRGRGGAHGSGGGGGALGMGGRGHGRPEGAHLVAVPHDVSLPRQVVVHQAPAGAQRSSARAAPAGPRETAGKGGGGRGMRRERARCRRCRGEGLRGRLAARGARAPPGAPRATGEARGAGRPGRQRPCSAAALGAAGWNAGSGGRGAQLFGATGCLRAGGCGRAAG